MNDIIGSGVLPIAIKNEEIYALLGRENNDGSSNNTWCGFGGGTDKGETIIETAIREFMEETMAIIMSREEIENIIRYNKDDRLIARYVIRDPNIKPYVENVILINYDDELPILFSRVYQQFNRCNKLINKSCQTGQCNIIGIDIGKTCLPLFEKDEIGWFKLEEIIKLAEDQKSKPYGNHIKHRPSIILRPCFIEMILAGCELIEKSIENYINIQKIN